MKSQRRKFLGVFLWQYLFFVLSGCSSPTPIITNLESTEAKNTPTLTPTPDLINPPPPPTQTRALIPPTSISTLSAKDASDKIYKLLSEGNNCLFPCWWGLEPGQTRTVDAQNFLSSFGSSIIGGSIFKKEEGYIYFLLPQSQSSRLHITFEFGGNNETLDWLQVILQEDTKTIHPNGETSYEISWGDQNLAQITKPYSISKVFSMYGKPTEVAIFTQRAVLLNQPHPISMVLFYPQQGFMIEYVANNRSIAKSSDATWCPDLVIPYFWFWSPSPEITRNDVLSWISGFNLYTSKNVEGRFKSLEEATGMTIEDIYKLYIGGVNACIQTPKEIWPMPYE